LTNGNAEVLVFPSVSIPQQVKSEAMPNSHSELVNVCPRFHRAVELIGRRWTGAILSSMLKGTTRFTDIVNSVPGLSDRLLSERLKELELEGIVERRVHPETPVRIEYTMTEKGLALSAVTNAIASWAEEWITPETPVNEESEELVTA
jgi:DNA-binding HxlR family transcriptional regulator